MTIEELELDPRSNFVGREAPPELPEPLHVGLWKCPECKVWTGGVKQDVCRWCANWLKEKERLQNESIERDGEMPAYIFKRINEEGKVVYSMVSDDGRVVDVDY